MTNPAPPQQPNRPEGLDKILWNAMTQAITASINSDSVDTSERTAELFDEALTAIRTRIEAAIGEDEVKVGQYEFEGRKYRNKLRAEIKSNIQRELGI
jgi:ribosomal protein S13